MNEWLDEELEELDRKKKNKAEKDNRSDLLQRQTEILWKTLKPILKDAVAKMNVDGTEFRKLTGGLAYVDGSGR